MARPPALHFRTCGPTMQRKVRPGDIMRHLSWISVSAACGVLAGCDARPMQSAPGVCEVALVALVGGVEVHGGEREDLLRAARRAGFTTMDDELRSKSYGLRHAGANAAYERQEVAQVAALYGTRGVLLTEVTEVEGGGFRVVSTVRSSSGGAVESFSTVERTRSGALGEAAWYVGGTRPHDVCGELFPL